MTDKSLQRSNCGCKYCTRTPQRDINLVAKLRTGSRSAPASVPSPSKALQPSSKTDNGGGIAKIPELPSVNVHPADILIPQPLLQPQELERVLDPKKTPFFAIRKGLKPAKPSTGPEIPANSHRIADLEGVDSSDRKRLHRVGKVIWCFLDVPIARPGEDDGAITAWPGVVESIQWPIEITIVINKSFVQYRKGND